ncbi:MAG: endolytic transglycosylase MltG [Ignavibacteriales bacterium]|nr:endolytic transglycosylase MltG [Ignavibacteriales bacterium]
MQKNKIILKNILTKKQFIIIIAFFLIVFAVLAYTFFSPNYFEGKKSFRFEIKTGTTLNQVIDTLYNAGIIPGKRNMRIAAFLLGAEKSIKAGRYEIPNGINYVNLVEMFKEGLCEVPVYVHLYDGISLKVLARVLKEKVYVDSVLVIELSKDKKFIQTEEFNVSSLEGYLLPGDYYFYKETPVKEIIEKLKSNFDKFISTDSLQKQIKKLKYNLHQILTMASIIQGESKKVDEYITISGVYYNRLQKGMKLQADPTIQYSLNTGWRRLLKNDLKINNPYNTYVHFGLPPGPINNPGKAAILSALYPEKHSYLFFVADGKGGHKFTRNYTEHLKAVKEYRKWFGEQVIK